MQATLDTFGYFIMPSWAVAHASYIGRRTHSSFPPQLGQSNLTQNLRNEKGKKRKKTGNRANGVHGSDNTSLISYLAPK